MIVDVEALLSRKNDAMIDLLQAKQVELLFHKADGRVWVNVDGVCLIRIQNCGALKVKDNSKEE